MENCGMELFDYFNPNENKLNKSNKLKKLIGIFKQCCSVVQEIHNLGYLYLNICPENFMIYNKKIKICCLEFMKKNNYETNHCFGSAKYIANDWIKMCGYQLIKNKRTEEYKKASMDNKIILTYHHDIFSLGCMFIELLYSYVFEEEIVMACPIIKRNNKAIQQYVANRNLYDVIKFTNMIDTINNDCLNNSINKNIIINILNVIKGMVNPVPGERYQSINNLINNLNNI